MKQNSSPRLSGLATLFKTISRAELETLVGGYDQSCYFNCLDYFDGDTPTSAYYYQQTRDILGYEPGRTGGIVPEDIAAIGSFGRMKVTDITSGWSVLPTNGKTPDGDRVMIEYNETDAKGKLIGHVVALEGMYKEGDVVWFRCYDPTTKKTVSLKKEEFSGIYSVGKVGSIEFGGENAEYLKRRTTFPQPGPGESTDPLDRPSPVPLPVASSNSSSGYGDSSSSYYSSSYNSYYGYYDPYYGYYDSNNNPYYGYTSSNSDLYYFDYYSSYDYYGLDSEEYEPICDSTSDPEWNSGYESLYGNNNNYLA